MKEKTAIPLEGTPGVVELNNGERMKRAAVEKAGYRILGAGETSAKSEKSEAVAKAESWRMAILCLPEARERAAAAEEIVNTQGYHTMCVDALSPPRRVTVAPAVFSMPTRSFETVQRADKSLAFVVMTFGTAGAIFDLETPISAAMIGIVSLRAAGAD